MAIRHQAASPAPTGGGLSTAAIILLWIFVGWPVSWFLLFLIGPFAFVFGIGITIWMIVAVVMASNRTAGVAQPQQTVVVNVGGPPSPAVPPRHGPSAIREQVEGLAAITPIGSCGWCGSTAAHRTDDGYPVHPRHWHAAEIEERIRSRSFG